MEYLKKVKSESFAQNPKSKTKIFKKKCEF